MPQGLNDYDAKLLQCKKQVKVDHYPQCAGTWLDRGELDAIQDQYKNECDREQDADAYLEREFRKLLSAYQ